jgi:hypothetical protein
MGSGYWQEPVRSATNSKWVSDRTVRVTPKTVPPSRRSSLSTRLVEGRLPVLGNAFLMNSFDA